MIKLGDEVKDNVTGFKGIAIGIIEYLHGCKRYIVQPKGTDKEGHLFDTATFDEPQMELVVKKKVKRQTETGGWKPNVDSNFKSMGRR